MIALVRPHAWDLPLFLHVLGATALFGAVLTVATLSFGALRIPAHAALLRTLTFRTLLFLLWPAYVVMRVAAQWSLNKENLDTNSPSWVGVGFVVSDVGIVVLLLLTLLAWLSKRRPWAGQLVAGLSSLYLVALGVAWFYMSAKP